MGTKYNSSVGGNVLLLLTFIGLFILLSQSRAHPVPEDNISSTESSGNNTQDAYIIESVQFEIGTLESEEIEDENATTLPAKTEKLSETQVAFLLPPAAIFHSTSSPSSHSSLS